MTINLSYTTQAQVKCLEAIQLAAGQMRRLIDENILDHIQDYEMTIEPYNSGYELTINYIYDKRANLPEDVEKFVFVNRNLHIQPDVYFHENLKDKRGSISYRSINRDKSFGEYCSILVKDMDEVSKACQEFINSIN